jgi:hypothetical protein
VRKISDAIDVCHVGVCMLRGRVCVCENLSLEGGGIDRDGYRVVLEREKRKHAGWSRLGLLYEANRIR